MPCLLVPSHHDVAQDVFGETDGPLELARLVRRQRELEDAVMAVTVVRDLVGQAPAGGGRVGGVILSILPPRPVMAVCSRSLTALRRSSSAVGGMRYMSS